MRIANRKVIIIGCNIGPIHTMVGRLLFNLLFRLSTSISVRDKESYNYLHELGKESPILAPDIVFSSRILNKHQDCADAKLSIGISVINLGNAELQHKYNCQIKEIINHIHSSYSDCKIILFSCQGNHEGDEIVVNHILSEAPANIHLEKVLYRGNIQHFINEMGICKHFICTRFHSMIIAIKLGIPFTVLSYSKKIDNVLDDLGYESKIYQCGKITSEDVKSIVNNIGKSEKFTPDVANADVHLCASRLK